MDRARRAMADRPESTAVPATTKVLLISSGKGGVGKSSVTVNLACALAPAVTGWGCWTPTSGASPCLACSGSTAASAADTATGKILPERVVVGPGSVDVVSMGLLVDEEGSALMWRGLILNRAVRHFLEDVAWGELDYLLVDMPPGTGDVQMGLAKMLPRAEMLVVTTPSLTAQKVAVRVVDMGRKNYLHIAGVIENMSSYVDDTGREHRIFGEGGGRRLAAESGAPPLGQDPHPTRDRRRRRRRGARGPRRRPGGAGVLRTGRPGAGSLPPTRHVELLRPPDVSGHGRHRRRRRPRPR